MEEGLVLYLGEARVVQVLAVHERPLLREVPSVGNGPSRLLLRLEGGLLGEAVLLALNGGVAVGRVGSFVTAAVHVTLLVVNCVCAG